MACIHCAHPQPLFHERYNKSNRFCHVSCQSNYYRLLGGGILWDLPCEVYGCEEWTDEDCYHEDPSFAMCKRHCEMRKREEGIYFNYEYNRWQEQE